MQINQTNQVLFREKFGYYIHTDFFLFVCFALPSSTALPLVWHAVQHPTTYTDKSEEGSSEVQIHLSSKGFLSLSSPSQSCCCQVKLPQPLPSFVAFLQHADFDCTSMILSTCHEMWSHPNGNLHAHVQNRKLFWLNEMQQLQQLSEQEQRSSEAKPWQAAKNVFMSLSWYEITSVGGGGEICRYRW